MDKLPLVSLCMSSFNNARYVIETLDSLAAQVYQNIELIIVDDCSQDNSVELIELWLVNCCIPYKFIKHEYNTGVCRVANDLIANSSGEYISIIASDDVMLPDKICHQVSLLHKAPGDVGVLTSAIELMDADGNQIDKPLDFARPHPEYLFIPLLESCFIAAMSTLIRRSCFDKVGLFDESLPFEDWDMWLRIAKEYKFIYSPKVSVRYRRHSTTFFEMRKRQDQEGSLMLLNKHRGFSPQADAIIIAQTRLRSELLYHIGSPQAAYWLHVRWQDSRDLRSLALYTLAKLGVSGQWVVMFQRTLGR